MPRDTLTREQIVSAAIDLLDAEGLEGLNMRALGQRLGSAATAVYWHVGSKDNLIALAADQVWSEIARPDPDTAGWRGAGPPGGPRPVAAAPPRPPAVAGLSGPPPFG